MKLYHKAQSTGQGIIADEETGRTIAVVYDSKDGELLAAAPELLEALEKQIELTETLCGTINSFAWKLGIMKAGKKKVREEDWTEKARAALSKGN